MGQVSKFEDLFHNLHRQCKMPLMAQIEEKVEKDEWDEVLLETQVTRSCAHMHACTHARTHIKNHLLYAAAACGDEPTTAACTGILRVFRPSRCGECLVRNYSLNSDYLDPSLHSLGTDYEHKLHYYCCYL